MITNIPKNNNTINIPAIPIPIQPKPEIFSLRSQLRVWPAFQKATLSLLAW